MNITSDDAARYVVKAAWAYREYEHTAISIGARSKATAIARAKFDGLADGADGLGLAMTPHAFFMAVKEAFEEVGDLERNVAGSAEKAGADRLAWTDAMYGAVARRLSLNDHAHHASTLLGQEVVVTLSRGDGEEPAAVARGTLLAWADSGEVVVRDEMGFTHYCWPMLDIAPAEKESAPQQ